MCKPFTHPGVTEAQIEKQWYNVVDVRDGELFISLQSL
jgi:hypothetical protein